MAMPLAFGYLAVSRRTPQAPARDADGRRDDLADRPPIPRGVISWSDHDLPVGAGDPAVAVDGPPSFHAWRESAPCRRATPALESVLFSVLLAAIVGAASIGTLDIGRGVVSAGLAPDANPALLGRVPVVETRILSLQPVIDTASRTSAHNASDHGG